MSLNIDNLIAAATAEKEKLLAAKPDALMAELLQVPRTETVGFVANHVAHENHGMLERSMGTPQNIGRNRLLGYCPACQVNRFVLSLTEDSAGAQFCLVKCLPDASGVCCSLDEIVRVLAQLRRRAEAERARAKEVEDRQRKAEWKEQERIAKEERERDPVRFDLQTIALQEDPKSYLEMLSGDEIGNSRLRSHCPVCQTDAPGDSEALLVCHHDFYAQKLAVRCIAGCEPGAIVKSLESAMVLFQERLEREADEREARDAAQAIAEAKAACSLGALRNASPIRWLIPGVSPAAFVLKYGDKGARKTFDAIHKALCIASGTPYYGTPVERGKAMLVLLEGGAEINARYLNAIAGGLGIDLAAIDGETLFVYPGQLDVEDDDSWDEFAAMVHSIGPDWIGIDNLTQVRGSSHENDNAAAARIMKRLERLCKDRKIGIELLHHESKAGGARGASSTEGGVDVMFRMKAGSAKNDALVTLERAGKDRTGRAVEKLQFRYVDQEDGSIVPTLADAPAAVKRDKRQAAMLKAIEQSGGVTNVRTVLPTWSSREVKSVRDELEGAGLIVKVEGVWQVTADDG